MSKQILKIHVFGPSGSGKGTQVNFLKQKLNLPSASMGELLRAAAKEPGERGKAIETVLVQGTHVDNLITNELIFEWITKQGQTGYIIEGYPRNRGQFEYFEARDHFTHAISLEVSDEETRVRMNGRRVCSCGKNYHMKYDPPKHNETCDECGAKLEIRHDSSPEATEERIRLYHEAMLPLKEEYKQQGILHEVNGEQSIEQVRKDIAKLFP
jgi:adenylate kinase